MDYAKLNSPLRTKSYAVVAVVVAQLCVLTSFGAVVVEAGNAGNAATMLVEQVQSPFHQMEILLTNGTLRSGQLMSVTDEHVAVLERVTSTVDLTVSMISRRDVVAMWPVPTLHGKALGWTRRPDGTVGQPLDGAEALLQKAATRARGQDEIFETPARASESAMQKSQTTKIGVGLLELRDGQKFSGALSVSSDQCLWTHPWLGSTAISIDDVQELQLRRDTNRQKQLSSSTSDIVELINGDTVEGFVESISDDLIITADSAGAENIAGTEKKNAQRIPITRVARIRFSESMDNASTEGSGASTEGSGASIEGSGAGDERVARLWLRDGSVLDAIDLVVIKGLVARFQSSVFTPTQAERDTETTNTPNAPPHGEVASPTLAFEVSLDDITAIALYREAFVPAVASHIERFVVTDDFRARGGAEIPFDGIQRTRDDALGVATLRLNGPTTILIDAPDQTHDWIFVSEVVLDDTSIPGASAIVNMSIAVDHTMIGGATSGATVAFTLDAAESKRWLHVPLGKASIRIELREGAHGIVGNCVRFERAMFLRADRYGA